LKRIEQKIAQWTTLDLRTFPGPGHPAGMIMENRSLGIGKAKTIEIRPVIGPERIYQTGSFQCR
jgi:hypothetical protein